MFAQRKSCAKITDSRLQLTTEVGVHRLVLILHLTAFKGSPRDSFDQILCLGAILHVEGRSTEGQRDTCNQGDGVSLIVILDFILHRLMGPLG